jgi:CHRD domain
VNGPVVVDFEAPADGFSADCLRGLDKGLLTEIAHDHTGFYVNVHNPEFTGGAIRGQLR